MCLLHSVPPTHAVPSGLRELLAGATPLSSGAQPTPGAAGPSAPAPTPATGAQPASAEDGAQPEVVMNPQTLATKLAELAGEHDVTVEVPAVSCCCRSGWHVLGWRQAPVW